MKKSEHEGQLQLSATDLANHLGCQHLTRLECARAHQLIESPDWHDPTLEVLRERGLAHENAYLDFLREQGVGVESVNEGDRSLDARGVAVTRELMARGAEAIVQAPLVRGRWRGFADVLLRVDEPSDLGAWSYIAVDTKLAFETRGGTVLQLCLYSDLLSDLQGRLPDEIRVISPGRYDEPDCFRTSDFMAYYRRIRAELEGVVAEPMDSNASEAAGQLEFATYPEPVPQCDICKWWSRCDKQRHVDDHLSLVAGISRLQRDVLVGRDVDSLTALAGTSMPLAPRPKRGSPESYERVHHQARIQLESRNAEKPLVEVLPAGEPETGLARLPEPSPGDLFFDFEGDPFVDGGGLEYLFGWVELSPDGSRAYEERWALTHAEEKHVFESWIDFVVDRIEAFPGLHIYHFAPYEPAALKRLMGRHATREAELDFLLRSERFVDLHQVVKESLRIGVEAYGLKQLEAVHGFERELDLRDASAGMRTVERALELGQGEAISHEERARVAVYNKDDCLSTLSLRDWLEEVRSQQVGEGVEIVRATIKDGDPSEKLDEALNRRRKLAERMTEGLPEDPGERTPEEHGIWLLAQLLEWHRRESKATAWELFRLEDLAVEDLAFERHGLYGLEFLEELPVPKRQLPVHRYRFVEQDFDIRVGNTLKVDRDFTLGKVVDIDPVRREVDVKKNQKSKDEHPVAAFAHDSVRPYPIPEAIETIAEWVAENGIDAPGPYRAARDLLMRRRPRFATPIKGALSAPGEDSVEAAKRLALDLDGGVLAIQGPPGTGKSHAGARMICALVAAGQKVGITANSHKVIVNLIKKIPEAAEEMGVSVRCAKRRKDKDEEIPQYVIIPKTNDAFDQELASGSAQVGGATVWGWARSEAFETLDTLVVDEAGQLSLANAVAASQAARNLILLGDPQQLDQPIQGSHPDGSEVSVLDHLLEGRDTISEDRGLFLPETWRLHPDICAFTSETYYEGKLRSRSGCEGQRITGPTRLAEPSEGREGAGLWYVPCSHEGNQTSAPEEVEVVARLVEEFGASGVEWTDREGVVQPVGLEEILVVAPYNAQVAALRAALPADVPVGTVDKFQGQEAPIVIYSMTTSSAEDAPRGLEFLLSANRLNVATSRAQCAVVIVGSPKLMGAECRSPKQMKLVNAICRYGELAEKVPS
ncbi:MAG: TM0106 family RecB-like putative nuclease [bacterium]|nr:TM0106 family RecB-like putative nuclease [bacterium]